MSGPLESVTLGVAVTTHASLARRYGAWPIASGGHLHVHLYLAPIDAGPCPPLPQVRTQREPGAPLGKVTDCKAGQVGGQKKETVN